MNKRLYKYTFPTLYLIYKTEGFKACYKGFAPKVIRMGLGGAVCMGAFEATCHILHGIIENKNSARQDYLKIQL